MARRKVELFLEINDEKEFNQALNLYENSLICAEIYSIYFGSCTALDRLFNRIKLDWSDGKMILLKVPSDKIDILRRFRNQSEPVYVFIVNKKATKVFRGVDSIKFAELAKSELCYFNMAHQGVSSERSYYQLDEPTPDEMDWLNTRNIEKEQEESSIIERRTAQQASRKRHRAELMVPHLKHLNFVLFWPHAKHAHPELYEKWDENNIVMVGREELMLSEEKAMDVLYAGDAPINEASMHMLLSGPSLVICFRSVNTDNHFVSMVRKILYEDIINLENEHAQCQGVTAFDRYKSYSLSREEVWQKRREERIKRKIEEREKQARRMSEMLRLKRQAREEAKETKKTEREQRKLDLLKAGNLSALNKLNEESDDEDVAMVEIPLEMSQELDEDISEEEDENEYLPPAGLLVPGFYAPPNDIAKANGLAVLFPKLVSECVTPQPEYLPPHVLVMLEVTKRYEAIQAITKHKQSVIHIKEWESDDVKIVFMLSIQVDLALLELMDLNPMYVSRDPMFGEEECAIMFPVGYGDAYPEFEDFDD
ncbi:thioredoxin domain-containing protein 3 homolog [Aphomia sociella]